MKKIFFLILLLLIIPYNFSFALFGIGGAVGGFFDKVGRVFGAPMEMATSSSIDNMNQKLDENIDHLDEVLSKNSKDAIGNFDEVLKMREDQLDTLMQRNIQTFDSSLSRNLSSLDNIISNGVGGLKSVVSNFDTGLWVFSKTSAQLLIFVITIYFIFSTYRRININGNFSRRKFIELYQESKFYIVILVISVLLIYAFKPLAGSFVDPAYQGEIKNREVNLTASLNENDIKGACIYSQGLSILKPEDSYYQYTWHKINVIKYLFYSSDLDSSQDKLNSEMTQLNEFYKDFENNHDPEYFIVKALFEDNLYNNKKGRLKASIDCIKFLENRTQMNGQKFKLNLEPNVELILSKYFVNPYDSASLNEILIANKITLNKFEIGFLLNQDDSRFQFPTNLKSVEFKLMSINSLKNDQQSFYEFLQQYPDSSTPVLTQIREGVIKNWSSLFQKLLISEDEKFEAHAAMTWNDFLAQSILKNYPSRYIDSLNSVNNDIINNNANLRLAESDIANIYSFKKWVLFNLPNYIDKKNDLALPAYMNMAINDSKYSYSKIDTLISCWQDLPVSIRKSKSNLFQITNGIIPRSVAIIGRLNLANDYKTLIRISAELNLYYRWNKFSRPLSYFFIDDAFSKHAYLIKDGNSVQYSKSELKGEVDEILEENYYR